MAQGLEVAMAGGTVRSRQNNRRIETRSQRGLLHNSGPGLQRCASKSFRIMTVRSVTRQMICRAEQRVEIETDARARTHIGVSNRLTNRQDEGLGTSRGNEARSALSR